jgi:hypothetical protein
MAPYGGDDQRIITRRSSRPWSALERQAVDLLAPALDVGANVGWDLGLTIRLKRLQDLSE